MLAANTPAGKPERGAASGGMIVELRVRMPEQPDCPSRSSRLCRAMFPAHSRGRADWRGGLLASASINQLTMASTYQISLQPVCGLSASKSAMSVNVNMPR
jgi:hypothetical protein